MLERICSYLTFTKKKSTAVKVRFGTTDDMIVPGTTDEKGTKVSFSMLHYFANMILGDLYCA